MIVSNKVVRVIVLSLGVSSMSGEHDGNGSSPLIVQAKEHLQEERFSDLYRCLNEVSTLDAKPAALILKEVFQDCGEEKEKRLSANLNAAIAQGDKEAYHFLGIMSYLGCPQSLSTEEKIKAAHLFYELTKFPRERTAELARSMLRKIDFSEQEGLRAYQLLARYNSHKYATEFLEYLAMVGDHE